MSDILTIKNLTYKSVLKDLNLSIKKDTINLITGSNKCGKTTLIKILNRVIDAENSCFFNNKDICSLKSLEYSKNFSHVIFTGSFNFKYQVLEKEFLFNLDKSNLDSSERKMKYRSLLKIFNLRDKVSNSFNELSYYDKVKSLVMFSVIRSPKVLLLDNVFDDLSDVEAKKLLDAIKRVGGMTVIVGSDKLNIAYLFDYIHVLDKGSIILTGQALDVLREDSKLNKIGLSLPFMVDLSIKLNYYGLVDEIMLEVDRMVDKLWK